MAILNRNLWMPNTSSYGYLLFLWEEKKKCGKRKDKHDRENLKIGGQTHQFLPNDPLVYVIHAWV